LITTCFLIPHISEAKTYVLSKPFSTEKVKATTIALVGDKAPGPDGFSLFFCQACWEIIHEDLLKAIEEFMQVMPI